MSNDPRRTADDALCHSEPPFLKYYQRGRFRRVGSVSFTGSCLPGPGFNFAACTGETPPLADVVAAAREFFDDPGDAWGVLVPGDTGDPMEAELKANGWTVAEDEPAFVLPDLQLAARAESPAGLTHRPLRTPADRATFMRVTGEAYGAPPEFADLIMPSLDYALDPAMIWLLADWNGHTAAACGGYRVGPACVICCMATLDEHRGRGIGAAMMRELLTRFANAGSTLAVLRSGPKSVPLYERCGFRYVVHHRTYVPPVG